MELYLMLSILNKISIWWIFLELNCFKDKKFLNSLPETIEFIINTISFIFSRPNAFLLETFRCLVLVATNQIFHEQYKALFKIPILHSIFTWLNILSLVSILSVTLYASLLQPQRVKKIEWIESFSDNLNF